MNVINNGGPAFPAGSVRKSRRAPGDDWVETNRVQPLHGGLSIRDYFAAKAMQALVSDHRRINRDDIAWAAYDMADAMLRAREAS